LNKILLLGYSGFPLSKSAACEKQKLIAKAISLEPQMKVEILNNISFNDFKYDRKGVFEGVSYRLTCLFSIYPNNKVSKLLNLIYGCLNEYLYVMFSTYDYIIISSRNSIYILGHIMIAKLRNKKITLTMVEDYKSMNLSSSKISNLKAKLYFKYVLKYIDGVFPISTLITQEVIKTNYKLPFLELPVFTNFENFKETLKVDETDYFLFCGSAGYFDTIKFIIDSYTILRLKSKLILIISGNKNQIEKVLSYIKDLPTKNDIICKSNLTYRNLVGYYKNSNALLIPLNPNVKDAARFPHKIAEYCASSRPIISSNLGEVKNFFVHEKNALLINNHEIKELNSLMKYVEENPVYANEIGKQSYELGNEIFNYRNYGVKIVEFLKKI